ncbi:hypothetical protein ACJX0J_024449, partial [Zea mays]
ACYIKGKIRRNQSGSLAIEPAKMMMHKRGQSNVLTCLYVNKENWWLNVCFTMKYRRYSSCKIHEHTDHYFILLFL